MKKNFKKALMILPVLPMLMGVSLSEVYARSYKDYVLTYQREDYVDSDAYYTFKLKNTGKGYISYVYIDDITYRSKASDYYGDLFEGVCFSLDFEGDICFRSSNAINEPLKIKSEAYAYTDFDEEATISGTKNVTFANRIEKYYIYDIDLTIENIKNTNNNYGVIIELTYEDTNYCVMINNRPKMQLSTTSELDLSKLVINKAVVVQSTSLEDPALMVVVICAIVILYIFVPAVIFCAIFFPIRARRRRRRKLAAQKQMEQEQQ